MTIKIRTLLVLTSGSLMLFGAGCTPSSSPQAANTAESTQPSASADVLVTFRGKVIDAQTKQPIPYAWIAATRVGMSNPITNDRGEFTLSIEKKNVHPGASINAFQLYAGAWLYQPPKMVTVAVADSAKPITFELTPEPPPRGGLLVYLPETFTPSADGANHISGRVLDATSGKGLDMTAVIFGGQSSVKTDADGRFSMTVPLAGPIRIFLLNNNPKYQQDNNTYYQFNTHAGATTNVEFKIDQKEKTVN